MESGSLMIDISTENSSVVKENDRLVYRTLQLIIGIESERVKGTQGVSSAQSRWWYEDYDESGLNNYWMSTDLPQEKSLK